ncbi:hypothetical protein [Pseudomonas sp.]|uniref:hypothetical protein n=1 Tax=Pseudomonas sp. TaxID=306 RepID=UPI003342B787
MENRTSFSVEKFTDGDTLYTHYQPSGGRISVLDRMTGYGYRDIETGYRCPSGQFWLASGGYDIRRELRGLSSDDEMAQWVIDRANTCTGGHDKPRVGSSLEWLLSRENWRPRAERVEGVQS